MSYAPVPNPSSRLPRPVGRALLGLHQRVLGWVREVDRNTGYNTEEGRGPLRAAVRALQRVLIWSGEAIPAEELERLEGQYPGILLTVLKDDPALALRPVYTPGKKVSRSEEVRFPITGLVAHYALAEHGEEAARLILEDPALAALPAAGYGDTMAHAIASEYRGATPELLRSSWAADLRNERGESPHHVLARGEGGARALLQYPSLYGLRDGQGRTVGELALQHPKVVREILASEEALEQTNGQGQSLLQGIAEYWTKQAERWEREVEQLGSPQGGSKEMRKAAAARELVAAAEEASLRFGLPASSAALQSAEVSEQQQRLHALLERMERHAVSPPPRSLGPELSLSKGRSVAGPSDAAGIRRSR